MCGAGRIAGFEIDQALCCRSLAGGGLGIYVGEGLVDCICDYHCDDREGGNCLSFWKVVFIVAVAGDQIWN